MYEPAGFSFSIFKSRYAFTESETWHEACTRVAQQMASAELPAKQPIYREKFAVALEENVFVPGGRVWANAGRPNASMLNCFVLDPNKDSAEGWAQSAYNMIVTSMRGGGVGDDFSDVRPRGATIAGQRGLAPGAVELMRLIDACAQPVRNGGQRRVALMFSLDLDHPDIEEFLNAKLVLGQLSHANVSVRCKHTKAFVKAVKDDGDIELVWKGRYKRIVKARALWNTIVTNAYNSAEPGVLNWELVESESNIYYVEKLASTNPCGELALAPMEPCCLGHVVLSRFVKDGAIDYPTLADTIRLAVRFLDNVLTVNHFPLPAMQEKSHSLRRIGLGTTALADTLALLGYRYGSEEGNKFTDKLFRFISKIAYEASVLLAVEKGPFPLCDPAKHIESGYMKRMPAKIRSLVSENGIRNCAILTQAPTGTVSILSGNCSAGIEPMFAPAYERRYWVGEERKTELVFHPLFAQFMIEGKSVEHFVGSRDLSVRDHLEVQRIVQHHIDNAVSKCLVKGTLIPTTEGLRPIESFAAVAVPDSFTSVVAAYTSSGHRIVSQYWAGTKPSSQVRLDNGASIIGATYTHKVLTISGWQTLAQCRKGDKVIGQFDVSHGLGGAAIPWLSVFRTSANKLAPPTHMSVELAELLGMLTADGHTTEATGCVGLTHKNPAVAVRFASLCQSVFGVEPRSSTDKRNGVGYETLISRNLVRWVESLIGKGAYHKHACGQILAGSAEEKAAFLSGLCLDGYINQGRGLMVYEGMSESLAIHAAALARSFGLPLVRQGKKYVAYSKAYAYNVCVSNEAQRLIAPIEQHKHRAPSFVRYKVLVNTDELAEMSISSAHPHYRAYLYLRNRAALNHNKQWYCYNTTADSLGLKWAQLVHIVRAVTDVGDQDLYDIEVEGARQYTVNGIVSHNTINIPENLPIEEMEAAWLEYLPYLKGTTFYRENTRGYVNAAGVVEAPPLTALSLEAAREAYRIAQPEGSGAYATPVDCAAGTCDI